MLLRYARQLNSNAAGLRKQQETHKMLETVPEQTDQLGLHPNPAPPQMDHKRKSQH